MFVVIVGDAGECAEVLADGLTQGAGACAVEDAHLADAEENGIVHVVHHSLQRFVGTHAAHVELLLEGGSTAGHHFDGRFGVLEQRTHAVGVGLLLAELVATDLFEARHIDDGLDHAEGHLHLTAADRKHLSHRLLPLEAHGVARLESVGGNSGHFGRFVRLAFARLRLGVARLGFAQPLLLEALVLFAYLARCLLLGLRLLDVADGLLDAGIGLLHEQGGFVACLLHHLLATGLQFARLFVVLLRLLFEFLLLLVHLLALLLPVALVAADVLQVLVHVDIVGAHNLLGLFDHVARQADLVGNLEGERRTGTAQFEAEQGAHLAAVVEHGTVDDTGRLVGKELQVGVVGGDDAIHLQVV